MKKISLLTVTGLILLIMICVLISGCSQSAGSTDGNSGSTAGSTENSAELRYSVKTVEQSVKLTDYSDPDSPTDFTSTWSYPEIICSEKNDAIDAINESISSDFESLVEKSKAFKPDSEDSDEVCTTFEARVTYLDGSAVCIREDYDLNSWGAHGWSEISGKFFDLSTGESVSFEKILGEITDLSSADLREQAQAAINAYLEENPSDVYDIEDVQDTINDIAGDLERYYVTMDGIVVCARAYELGSYAWGNPEIVCCAFSDKSLVGKAVSEESYWDVQDNGDE